MASEPTLCPVTSARSAGSLRGFSAESKLAPVGQGFTEAGVIVPATADLTGLSARLTTIRMKPETAEKLEHWYKANHCRSRNEFVEKAVNFYADSLAAENSTTLPLAIQTAIDGRLKMLEDRVASILYKQTVEMDMAISILLQSVNVDESVLRQERAKSVAAVKHTNGRLRMEQKLRELENEEWQD